MILQKLDLSREQITLESTYYLSIADTSSADLALKTYTLFKRTKDREGNITIGIIRESLNTL